MTEDDDDKSLIEDAAGDEGHDDQSQPQETPEQQAEREAAEAEARKYGWRPREEFDRDPQGWVPASRFLELPPTQLKMMRDANRDLEKRLEEERKQRETDFARLETASRAALDRVRQQERQRFETELSQIRAAKRDAVEQADRQAYDRLEQREAEILRAAPGNAPPQPQSFPEIDEYRSKHEWTSNPLLWQEAVSSVDFALRSGRVFDGAKAQLEFAESVMRQKYPHLFPAAAEPAKAPVQSRVEGGGIAPAAGRRGKGADDLPADVRKVGQDYVREGIYKSLAEYAVDYFAQEAGR